MPGASTKPTSFLTRFSAGQEGGMKIDPIKANELAAELSLSPLTDIGSASPTRLVFSPIQPTIPIPPTPNPFASDPPPADAAPRPAVRRSTRNRSTRNEGKGKGNREESNTSDAENDADTLPHAKPVHFSIFDMPLIQPTRLRSGKKREREEDNEGMSSSRTNKKRNVRQKRGTTQHTNAEASGSGSQLATDVDTSNSGGAQEEYIGAGTTNNSESQTFSPAFVEAAPSMSSSSARTTQPSPSTSATVSLPLPNQPSAEIQNRINDRLAWRGPPRLKLPRAQTPTGEAIASQVDLPSLEELEVEDPIPFAPPRYRRKLELYRKRC
ncbi:hypothetical protein CC1G_09647 [Coprinopsis cinerea okayama7|uniref:Uncharacterized protein n=1 Tax=Coprinopsis cinerea (strain Okayama-7 / 130 / ATCC MYA-4618 / FGSC 9003) TaxID=240176 RepID=A8P9D1_COPC7|nr:hypothetical protein CC1G_09647 [Coprinopsis cinerea okayama7\|eukprot:XP_001839744.1 hypothetical protein CC1G_09647 [Coprinopsis cinerea okayama7\